MAEKKLKDKKVDFCGTISTRDDDGFIIKTFTEIAAGLWAHVRSLSRQEIVTAGSDFNEEEIVFTLNWREDLAQLDITKDYYLRFKGIYYLIKRVDPYQYYKDDLTLYCKYVGKTV